MEPKICSVLDCSSRSDQGDEEIYFYGFPRKPKYRKVWVAATGRGQWSAKRSSRICSKHFLPACFAEGEGQYLLEDAVPTEFIKIPPLTRPTPPRPKMPRSSTPLPTVLCEQYLEPDEIEEPAEWPELELNYSLEMRYLPEDQADPSMIVLRSTAASVPEPGPTSTNIEAVLRSKPDPPPGPSTDEVRSPSEEVTAILSLRSQNRPSSPARPDRHSAPKYTKSKTRRLKEGSGSTILPPWVRIPPERPARNPKEAGSTFRKKLFAFLRCPYNPLDIESDLRTLISLGVHIFILRRGNFRAVVNSLFRYLIKA